MRVNGLHQDHIYNVLMLVVSDYPLGGVPWTQMDMAGRAEHKMKA